MSVLSQGQEEDIGSPNGLMIRVREATDKGELKLSPDLRNLQKQGHMRFLEKKR